MEISLLTFDDLPGVLPPVEPEPTPEPAPAPLAPPPAGPYAQVGARLVERAYAALPIMPATKRPGSMRRGEWVGMNQWYETYSARLPSRWEVQTWSQSDAGVCVVCGPGSRDLVAIDIDTDDPQIYKAILSALPPSTVIKKGAKGDTRFYRGPGITESKSWNLGAKPNQYRVCDLIGPGRQTVLPPTLHMDTGEPYQWIGPDALDDVDPADLPELTADAIEKISAALAPFGYTAESDFPALAGVGEVGDGDSACRVMNNAALANLDAWVPRLGLYRCQRTREGYAAVATWRASNTGQAPEKRKLNLHVTPKGITDFGDGPRGYTAIDLVMAAKGCEWPEAFKILSHALGVGRGVEIALKAPSIASEQEPASDREPGDGREQEQGWVGPNDGAPKEGQRRAPASPKSTLVMTRASDIEPQRINWLWPNRIATGKLSLFAGNPGLGKSQLATYLAAVVTNGGDWPNGEGRSPIGNVIVFSAEDDAADTLVPRLIAAGANLDRVHIVEGVKVPNGEKQFHLADDIETLCEAIDRIGDVRLVTIDPITAYLGSDQKVDSHKNASVRSALAPLQSRAARLDFAAVGVSHLNKGGGTEALMRVLGSMAFVAAARAAFLVVAESGTERSLFVPMKNNIGMRQSGLAFRMVTRTIFGGIEAPAIEFDNDEITATADEALADSVGRNSGSDQDKSSSSEAMTFVRDLLREGAVASREMFERGKEAGISKRSIERAKASLGVTAHHRGEGGPSGRGEWIWELPVQVSFTKTAKQDRL